ncbi:aminopeptidase N [Moraxella sp. ZY200743]|uniref:aminopeptidase N n=1 Tax=Moraxella sp. ZY200743 TaxID=2911970 RepID=UPI003D7DBFB4
MTNQAPTKVYLKDYTPPTYKVSQIHLDIGLFDEYAQVEATLTVHRQHEGKFVLFGRELQLQSIFVNDVALSADAYTLDDETLVIDAMPDEAVVRTCVKIYPQTNTALEGLYQAGTGDDAMFVTQCEPEGFRKITFYPDHPDVLAEFTTRIEADKKYKTLLGNGNLIESGDLGERHFAVWHDPTLKPSYLFACVIANLDVMQDNFTTSEGREVLLEIYATKQDLDKCHVAMQALKDAMKWDEDNYGCAYDLDRYMIVATGHFNMGAMENKGLNIFNTSCVLASPQTTTDEGSFRVKSVVAHEYFHNWTGNRITCRDWFQLSLKEGLTVFRDQSFSGDFRSKAVQRIEDVAFLRAHQFVEDAGPLAHCVRPESFVEINNFYTMTIYEKGAEIVRMIANFLGKDKYRQGTDEYFRRYDGQAVTIEDFLSAMSVGDERVMDFLKWYGQPGTPELSGDFEFKDGQVVVNLSQKTRHVAGFDAPIALPIPVDTAIFDSYTGELLAQKMLFLTKEVDSFVFDGIGLSDGAKPIVSVLRNFSAPVKLNFEYSDEDLMKLVAFESEGFNRWQAIQTLVNRLLLGKSDQVSLLTDALRTVVPKLITTDPMLTARLFDIPSEAELAMSYDKDYNPKAVKAVRDALQQQIAHALKDEAMNWYRSLPIETYEDTPDARGRRLLRNVLLELLLLAKVPETEAWAKEQYEQANCMSERQGVLSAMIAFDLPYADEFVADFYERFKDEELVIDDWFLIQARSSSRDVAFVESLMSRKDYDWAVPNRVRTTLGGLSAKPVQLWSEEGLNLYLDAITKLDDINPAVASRMLARLDRWYTLQDDSRAYAKSKLIELQKTAKSKNVLEFINSMLSV